MNDKLDEERSELQGACEELIKVFKDLSVDGSTVGVKMVGEIDENPFFKACEQRFSGGIVELEHNILVSKWEDTIKDPHWYPFKRVFNENIMKEVVDEEDEKLKNLKQEWGEDEMNAVKTAVEELKEFNPSGISAVLVLWNFEHGRKATLKEAIAHLVQQIEHLKNKQT